MKVALGRGIKYSKKPHQVLESIHVFHPSGNLDLYVSCLPVINNTLLVVNHMKYARRLVKFYNSSMKLPSTHPDVYLDYKSWHLTFEHIINAYVFSLNFSITSMTNWIFARKHCVKCHFFRITIISPILNMIDQKKKSNTWRNIFNMELCLKTIHYYLNLHILCVEWWIHSGKLARKDHILSFTPFQNER